MKTKRIGIIVLVAVAILGLALMAKRQGGGKPAEVAPNTQTVPAEVSGGAPDSAKQGSNAVVANLPADEPTPEMLESLTTATAQITRGDGSQLDIRSIDHEFDPLKVEPNEILKIRVALRDFDANRPILVEADNGGSLNRKVGPLALLPAAGDGAIEFQYSIGGNTGKYTLFLSQGNRQEFIELWAGPEMPVGQAGPPRSFNSEQLQSKRMGK